MQHALADAAQPEIGLWLTTDNFEGAEQVARRITRTLFRGDMVFTRWRTVCASFPHKGTIRRLE